MLLSLASLLLVFLPVCLAGPIDQPAFGDIGTGSGETSDPGQFNGGLGNAALTGNLVASIPSEDYSSSIDFITGAALGAFAEPSSGVQQSANDQSTLAEQTDANPEGSTDFLIAQSRQGVSPTLDGSASRGEPVRLNPNLGWETPGVFGGFPPTVDADASMRDPATRRSNDYMDYYKQPQGQCDNNKFLKCCWEGLVRCFEFIARTTKCIPSQQFCCDEQTDSFYNGINCGGAKFAAGTRAVGPVPEQYQLAPDQTETKPSYPDKKKTRKGKTQNNEFQDVQPGLVSPPDPQPKPIYENGSGGLQIPSWLTPNSDGSDNVLGF